MTHTVPLWIKITYQPKTMKQQHHPEQSTPLWQIMIHAYDRAPMGPNDADDDIDRYGYTAEILAVRDWLKMQLPEGGAWYALLTAEAERAEAEE